jgi:3',5'-cyclic AMP phosphodiesterase CpdA
MFKYVFLFLLISLPASAKVKFVQISDTQFGWYADNSFKTEKRLQKKFLKRLNEISPDFIVITGDLVDMPKINKKRKLQISAFKDFLNSIQFPIKLVAGNHDVENIPTKKSIDDYRENFGPDYYAFEVNNIKFMVLNSSLYNYGSVYRKEQNEWINNNIKNTSIVFSHHQIFLNSYNEKDNYFSFRKKLRDILFTFKDVDAVFAGHLHMFKENKWNGVGLVSAPSIFCPRKSRAGFLIVEIENNIFYSVEFLDDV